MPLEIDFQLSLFGRTSSELLHQMTGWIISPCSGPSCRTPNFQFLPLAAGHTPEWCEGDALIWPGGSWTPSIGQGPGWPEGSGSSSWPILEGGVLERYCLSPGQCSYFLALAQRVGCPPPPEIEALFLKQGGVYPSSAPFSPSVCGAPPSEGNAFSSATASDGQMTLFHPFSRKALAVRLLVRGRSSGRLRPLPHGAGM